MPPIEPTRPAGHALVVEDDTAVAGFMRALLEGWGLEVSIAINGQQALAVFRANKDAFDLVITNVGQLLDVVKRALSD